MTTMETKIIEEIPQPEVQEVPVAENTTENKVDPSFNSPLECNICYEEATEPVTTHCGHIFCWSCVYKWIEVKYNSAECPNCKNMITKEKLIPLYPKNYDTDKKNSDNPTGVPKRPLAAREENNRGLGHGLFTGINFRSRNFAVTIGCLPTLIPILMMIVVNVIAIFFDDDDDYGFSDTFEDTNFNARMGSMPARHSSQYESSDFSEPDGFDWIVIGIMILFVCLPFILRRFSRRNQAY